MARLARKQHGFTLVELLIVVIVLGLLAAIVVFAVGSTRADPDTGRAAGAAARTIVGAAG